MRLPRLYFIFKNLKVYEMIKMKNISIIFLITIFSIAIINSVYADNGPKIGENQAKYVAQSYLNSHNIHYNVTTATSVVKIKNKETGETKWVTWAKWHDMSYGYYLNNSEDPGYEHFDWNRAGIYGNDRIIYDSAWKIAVVDNHGESVGNIWVNDIIGEIMEMDLKSVDNTNSNQTPTNQTPTSQTPTDNTGIILATGLIVVIIGAGYWMYIKR